MAVNYWLKLLCWLPDGTVGFVLEDGLFLLLGVDTSSQLKAQLRCLLGKWESSLHHGDFTGREFLGGRCYPHTTNVPREARGVRLSHLACEVTQNYFWCFLLVTPLILIQMREQGTMFSRPLPLRSFIVLKTLRSFLPSPTSKGHVSSFYLLT